MSRAALVAALILAAAPSTAMATDVSGTELAELAAAARSDPAALAELEAVTSVDGAPANVAAALEGASGSELDARLAVLEGSAPGAAPEGAPPAAEARARASQVLADDELRPPEPSGGGGIELPGVPLWLALVVALALAVVAALVARSFGRASVIERERANGEGAEPSPRARDLEREAAAAERRGDYATAVRLRFQAGLLSLHALGAISLRPSLTAAGAARESGSELVGGLARSYERIAFGGREAGAGEAEEQRHGWGTVARELRRR